MDNTSNQICPGCGRGNECAVAAGRPAAVCWCMAATTRLPVPPDASTCYCAACLRPLAEKTDGVLITDAH